MSKSQAKSGTSTSSEKRYADSENGPPPPFAFFAENPQVLSSMSTGATTMEHMVATSQELARFYSDRMKRDMAAMSAFAECRTPAQFAEVWCAAASQTVHDYADEFDRVVAINLNGAAEEA